jgi:hypothetical protein
MTKAASLVWETSLSDPPKTPRGVRTAETMIGSLSPLNDIPPISLGFRFAYGHLSSAKRLCNRHEADRLVTAFIRNI